MCESPAAAEKSAAGAPEAEIEVTPEMIAAGKDAISRRWIDFVGPTGFLLWDEVMTDVFLAMSAARREYSCV
jgi:hypothetical protein